MKNPFLNIVWSPAFLLQPTTWYLKYIDDTMKKGESVLSFILNE